MLHLVTRCHFWSHDKDGGHTNRPEIANKAMLCANFTALCIIKPELLPMEVLHCRNREYMNMTVPCQDVTKDEKRTSFVKAFERSRITENQTYIHT